MKELKVKPIPTRYWKNKNVDLVVESDKDRKKSQESVDKRIYYIWFYLVTLLVLCVYSIGFLCLLFSFLIDLSVIFIHK